ncbi:hypothetical protein AB0J51_11660 [Micromonospora echinofusca]
MRLAASREIDIAANLMINGAADRGGGVGTEGGGRQNAHRDS